MARTNSYFDQIYKAYKEERGKNEYLGKRFVEFILKYCPPDEWEKLEQRLANMADYINEISGMKLYI